MRARLPAAVETLAAMFDHAAGRHPDRNVRTFFARDSLSFGRLARSGHAVARGLLAAGVEPRLPVAVLIRSNLELLQAMSGIAAAGAVIVPLPWSVGFGKASVARLRHALSDSGVRWAVVDASSAELFAELLPQVKTLTIASLNQGEDGGALATTTLPTVDGNDLALLQYTSGSTSNPKGVALTHRNVLAGIRALYHGVEARDGDVLCHWLPLSHDMGLISTLGAVGAGIDIRISPQQDFVKHPDDWLRMAGTFGATVLVGPNFFYRYLLDAIPREEAAGYDLSAVRVMLNGAEPIDPGLIAELGRHFGASGLSPHAMTPCYGLAEATLAVTFAPLERPATIDWVDKAALNGAGRAVAAAPQDAGARGIVDCGVPVPGLEVRITQDGRVVAERVVGEIEIRGESVMGGYYRELSASVAPDGWCPTGDLGYLAAGHLHVTGRSKEMLILGGQNYYPQDIEEAIRPVPGVHKGNAVAVVLPPDPEVPGSDAPDREKPAPERIGVLAEVFDASPPYGATVAALRGAAGERLGGAAVDVVLLRRNGLLRTTSGKFQRLLMRQQLLEGTLDRVLAHVRAGDPLPGDQPGNQPAEAPRHERIDQRRASSPR